MSKKPPTLKGCDVLPPMETPNKQQRQGTPSPKQRRKMTTDRFKLLNFFVDFCLSGLSRADMAVWLILYRDSRDGIASTGQSDIARRAGTCRRTVIRSIKKLKEDGLLTVAYQGGLNRGPSKYRIRPLGKDFTGDII